MQTSHHLNLGREALIELRVLSMLPQHGLYGDRRTKPIGQPNLPKITMADTTLVREVSVVDGPRGAYNESNTVRVRVQMKS